MTIYMKEIEEILINCESAARATAIYEDGELDYYEDEIDEVLDKCYEQLLTISGNLIPVLRNGEIEYKDIHPALRVTSIYDFANYLNTREDLFPNLSGYVETLQDWLWAPLHEELRKFFSLEDVKKISSELDFHLACRGYCESLELYSFHVSDLSNVSKAIEIISKLQELNLADEFQVEQMQLTLQKLRAIEQNFVPREKREFNQTTVGMEDEISSWIHEITTVDYLEDEWLEIETKELNTNLELLKENWLKLHDELQRVTGNKVWELFDSNIESAFRTERKLIGKKKNKTVIHCLYRLNEIVFADFDESYRKPLDRWKICLLRTGLEHEYLPNEGNGLLAAQMLIASRVLETSLDNISAEILWLRIGNRMPVLEGISRIEAEALAESYFSSH